MTEQIKPTIYPGYLVTEGNRVEQVVSILKDHVILRPIHAAARDMLDVMVPLDDLYSKLDKVDFGISPGDPHQVGDNRSVGRRRTKFNDLATDDQFQVLYVYCLCLAIDDLREKIPGKVTEAWCEANWEEINTAAENKFLECSGQKKRGKQKKVSYTAPCAKVLAADYAAYSSDRFHPDDHASQRARAGRKPTEIPDWAYSIIMAGLQRYFDGREPTAISCYTIIRGVLIEENKRLAAENLLHKPYELKRSKFYEICNEIKPSEAKATRRGIDELKRTLQTGLPDMRALVYGEIIQLDEYEMPLWVFLEKTGLHVVVGAKAMEQLRKEAESTAIAKVWLLVAKDIATGRIVAFNLGRNPNAEDTLELLRRLVSDTSRLAKAAGCENAPPPPVRPQLIIMDTGPGFWNNIIPLAILQLGSAFRYGRTQSPKDKASIESSFRGLGTEIMNLLHGHNGTGPGKQTGYSGPEMAVLSMAQIEQIMWRYIVDCLPFRSSQRKGSWGANNQLTFEMKLKRFGLLPPLSRREVRRALGLKVVRTVTTMGIECFRMPFQGKSDFRHWAINNVGQKVTVFVDPHRIEEVTVVTDDAQTFYLTAGLSQFRHFSLQEWIHFLEEWRASDPVTDEINALALYRFYQRLSVRMTELLDFYGKEHKVVRRDEVQAVCDQLAGGSLHVLPDDAEGSASIAKEDLFKFNQAGPAVFKPGDVLPDEGADQAHPVEPKVPAAGRAGAKASSGKKFTGKAKGKGKLL